MSYMKDLLKIIEGLLWIRTLWLFFEVVRSKDNQRKQVILKNDNNSNY